MEEEKNRNLPNQEEGEADSLERESEEAPEELDSDASSNDLTGDSYESMDSSGSEGYNPQNRYRRNQEYHNRQYYKDKVNDTQQDRDLANQKAREARANRDANKGAYKDARKSGDKDDIRNRKEEYKKSKQEEKEARKEYKEARRANRQAKIDKASDTANRVLHPVETGKSYLKNKANQFNPVNKLKSKAKQGINGIKEKTKQSAKNTAKKAGNAAKQGVKNAGKAAGKAAKAVGKTLIDGIAKLIATIPPPVWIGLAIITLIVGVVLLVMIIFIGAEDEALQGLAATTCTYTNMGGISDNTSVFVTDCGGEGSQTVSLEKYIAGVAVYNLGSNYNSEVMKALLIMLRSSILASAVSNTDGSYDSSKNLITRNQCDQGSFYWDYTKNLYKSEGEDPVYTYDETLGYPLYKEALTSEDIIKLESTAKQVSCMYLTNSNGEVVQVEILDELIQKITEQANSNDGSDNGTYTALLLQNIEDANGVASGQTNNASYFSADVGEYSQWKQLCSLKAPWCNVCMNKSCSATIDGYGCALTSLAMLIAHSGVDTSQIPNFNPGTFTDAMRNNGYLGSGGGIKSWDYITKLVPNFVFHKKVKGVGGDISKVRAYADQGFYIVLEVKTHIGGQHYVAVDNAASAAAGWSDIYVWNPSGNITHLSENKNYRANAMIIYEVKR